MLRFALATKLRVPVNALLTISAIMPNLEGKTSWWEDFLDAAPETAPRPFVKNAWSVDGKSLSHVCRKAQSWTMRQFPFVVGFLDAGSWRAAGPTYRRIHILQ